MDNNIDILNVSKENKRTKIFIKGWVHTSNYSIVLKTNGKPIQSSIKLFSRYDICKQYKEKIIDNVYGFEISAEISKNIASFDIFVRKTNNDYLIRTVHCNNFYKFTQKIVKVFQTLKKGLRFLWNEYHFIIPPRMMKKYLLDFINKIKDIRSNKKKYFNQEIPEEYHEWLQKQKMPTMDFSFDDITFLVLDDNNYNIIDSNKSLAALNHINKMIIDNHFDISKVTTKYVCILKNTCVVEKAMLYYVFQNKDCDFIYFDNDHLSESLVQINPFFKPDWSYDTLLGCNYIGNLFVIKKTLLSKINFENRNIYAYLLDIIDYIKKPKHISKIIFHEIGKEDSQKNIHYFLSLYFKQKHKKVDIIDNEDKETVSILYALGKKQPLVSIIIPTKDHIDILQKCIDSIYKKTTYKNFEIILIDNNSEKKETFEYLKKCKNVHSNFFVHRLECKFNYSYINNVAVKRFAHGDYILLLNNDTEVITKNWLEIMVGYASQKEIGTVGVKLIFPDNTIQHAGIIMGKGGLAGHAHYGANSNYLSSQWELKVPYNVSGCTAACLMISKEKYFQVGCLEEKLQVAFNDVDFNLKIRDAGYRNIFLPNVELYHYESKSRGLDTTPEKQKRFMQEWQFMENKWKKELSYDPFYNNNFSKEYDYKLDNKEV